MAPCAKHGHSAGSSDMPGKDKPQQRPRSCVGLVRSLVPSIVSTFNIDGEQLLIDRRIRKTCGAMHFRTTMEKLVAPACEERATMFVERIDVLNSHLIRLPAHPIIAPRRQGLFREEQGANGRGKKTALHQEG